MVLGIGKVDDHIDEVIEPQDGRYELVFQKHFTETIVADFKSKAFSTFMMARRVGIMGQI